MEQKGVKCKYKQRCLHASLIFDKVNYWKLFLKLLDDSVENKIVHVLSVWYPRKVAM